MVGLPLTSACSSVDPSPYDGTYICMEAGGIIRAVAAKTREEGSIDWEYFSSCPLRHDLKDGIGTLKGTSTCKNASLTITMSQLFFSASQVTWVYAGFDAQGAERGDSKSCQKQGT